MAYPSFSKTGVTTVTLSRGYAWPVTHPADEGQLVSRSQGGRVQVVTLRERITWRELPLVIPNADYTALAAFLGHANVNYQSNTFTFTDVDSTAYTVRYTRGLETFQQVSPVLWQGTLVLEIVA